MPDHPQRLVPLAGASNFRDLGGYPGQGGRALRWRQLYRSDHLGGLTAADHAELAARGVVAAFDFRGRDERAAAAYDVPGVRQHLLSIEPTVAQNMQALVARGGRIDEPTVVGLMQQLYRGLVTEQSARFAELFRHVGQPDGPLVFHCTAGKDRTGVAAALLLLALGVPLATVEHDYLLTNAHYQAPHMPRPDVPPEAMRALWSVRLPYLHAALETVDELGGLERYLREHLGVDDRAREALQARYLEAAPA